MRELDAGVTNVINEGLGKGNGYAKVAEMENGTESGGTEVAADVNADLPQGVMFAAYTVPGLRRTVTSEDGAYLDTLRLGRPPGRAVILCHGFGGNKNIRDFVAMAQ